MVRKESNSWEHNEVYYVEAEGEFVYKRVLDKQVKL